MLYTKKDIEKIYTEVLAKYFAEGARIDVKQNNYSCSSYECHTDLILEDNTRVIVFMKNKYIEGIFHYDSGICEIGIETYKRKDEQTFVLYKFFRFKKIFTDDENEFNNMSDTERKRLLTRVNCERNTEQIKYNPDIILGIVRKRKGYKRTKSYEIQSVTKRYGRYRISINRNGERSEIVIG